MTAATVTKYIETGLPSVEVVYLTFTDQYTYVSRKFKTITGAIATTNTDALNDIQVAFSSGTATLHCASASAAVCTLMLFGNHS